MTDCTFDFTGRTVVVTGGTSGIGHGIATGFAEAGAHVVITGTRPIETYDHDLSPFTYHRLDLADAAAIVEVAAAIPACHVLVNNAGGANRQPGELTPEGFESTIAVNLNGTFRMCHALHPRLVEAAADPAAPTASIINMASMMSYFGSPTVPGYAASKGGVVQLTRSLAQSWADDRIRVNAIAPGWIETNLTDGLLRDPERSQAILERTPLDRWGRPDDVAGPALFLASDAARFVTGAVVDVDGGWRVASYRRPGGRVGD
ncbi:MAG: SDR family NAD(P)-dependent oxidoreductase [Acidimicrobiales bacterium]